MQDMREEGQKLKWGGRGGGFPAPSPSFFFFFFLLAQSRTSPWHLPIAYKKDTKLIAVQRSKIAIQSIKSITGYLHNGKHASSSF